MEIAAFEFDKTAENTRGVQDTSVGRSEHLGAPNIIHIVLDGYSRADVLQELYDFDNAEFLNSLRALGFTIVDDATVPYGQTLLTMNSVLRARFY